jgi:hypothetical protein
MPRFKKKEPPFPDLPLTEIYPDDFLYYLSDVELEAHWKAIDPEGQRLFAERRLWIQLREKRRAEEKEEQAQLKERRARRAARAARTSKRRAKQLGK